MRLAIVCRPFVFHGGVETATAGLVEALAREAYQVDLITTAGQPPVPGVTVRRVPVARFPAVVRLLSFALGARRQVRARRYDVVQSHERGLVQDLYRAGEGTHRGYLEAMGRRLARANPYHRTVMALEKRIFQLRSAREVIAISRRGKAEIEQLYGTPAERVNLVYNGVDLARFHPDNTDRFRAETRETLGLPPSAWVILFVGSGFERKGLGPLLEGLGRLADRQARLVVAGKGQTQRYRRLAERLGVAGRIVWAGPRRDVERLYAAADVVALPALYEPFGNVHLEALAAGVPVLSSARAGGAELIRDGDNGWVVQEPAGALIAAALEAIHDGDRSRTARLARASAEPFTYRAQVGALGALYRRLAG